MPNYIDSGHTLLSRVVLTTYVVGLMVSVLGIILVYLGATGDTEFSFFGQTFKSTNVGITAIFLGTALIVLNIRRTLTSFDKTIQTASTLKNAIKAEGELLVSDIGVSHDREAQTCLVDFRVSNTGGSDVIVNSVLFQVLDIEETIRLGYMEFSKIYGLDISKLERKGDKIECSVSQVIHPGESDRFGITLVAREMPSCHARRWKLQPVLLSNYGTISTKSIEVWLEN